jgi:calcineurin-like phosphoesterase family protein
MTILLGVLLFVGVVRAIAVLRRNARRYRPESSESLLRSAARRAGFATVIAICGPLLIWNLVALCASLYGLSRDSFVRQIEGILEVALLTGVYGAHRHVLAEIVADTARWTERLCRRCVSTLLGFVEQSPKFTPLVVHGMCLSITTALLLIAFTLTWPSPGALNKVIDTLSGLFSLRPTSTASQMFFVYVSLRVAICVGLGILIFRIAFAPSWRMVFLRPMVVAKSSGEAIHSDKDLTLKIAHLSDLHCPEDGIPLTEMDRQWDDDCFSRLMTKLAREIDDYDAILLTGDITDRGEEGAWTKFFDRCPESLRTRMIILPGNHDLNLVGHGVSGLFWWSELLSMKGRNDRCHRFLEILKTFHGGGLVWCELENRAVSVSDFINRETRWHEAGQRHQNRDSPVPYADILNKLYPILVELPTRSQQVSTYCLTWNTVKPSSAAVFNAVGSIDTGQLARAEELLSSLTAMNPSAVLVHAAHHQTALPRELYRSQGSMLHRMRHLWQSAGMTIENASELVSWMERQKRETVIFHGHHHKYFCAALKTAPIDVVSASSSTLGCEGVWPEGTLVNGAGWSRVTLRIRNGSARVGEVEWVPLSESNSRNDVDVTDWSRVSDGINTDMECTS